MYSFNIQRFYKLREKKRTLEKNQKFLLHENPKEYLELVFYDTAIRDQYYFENASKLLSPLEDFLVKKKINDDTWVREFYYFSSENTISKDKNYQWYSKESWDEEDWKQVSTFVIDPRSKGFSELVSQLWNLAYQLDTEPHYAEDDEEEIDDDLFDQILKEIYQDMAEIYATMKDCCKD